MRNGTVLAVAGMMFGLFMELTTPHVLAENHLPLKIGYQSTSSDDWLLFAARDLKLFEKVGLALEYITFEAGPPMIAAAMNESIDAAIVKVAPLLEGLSQGLDWVVIGIYSEGAYSESLLARKNS